MCIIFIDWISPPQHKDFNKAFFLATNTRQAKVIVYSKTLVASLDGATSYIGSYGRLRQAASVLSQVYKNRKKRIFFLSYDPLFLPLARFLSHEIAVFEHNTTPELQGQLKHVIWQRLFLRSILRVVQFPEQGKRLDSLSQRFFYLGSPILPTRLNPNKKDSAGVEYFVVGSARVKTKELAKVLDFITEYRVHIKESIAIDGDMKHSNIVSEKFIDMKSGGRFPKGIIVANDSTIRGSGWFNDAISYGVPLILTNIATCKLFEETFPGHPYLDVTSCATKSDFFNKIDKLSEFNSQKFIDTHNLEFKNRFNRLVQQRWQD